jgi:hypothetical protein
MLPSNPATPGIARQCQRHDSERLLDLLATLSALTHSASAGLTSGHGKALRARIVLGSQQRKY